MSLFMYARQSKTNISKENLIIMNFIFWKKRNFNSKFCSCYCADCGNFKDNVLTLIYPWNAKLIQFLAQENILKSFILIEPVQWFMKVQRM